MCYLCLESDQEQKRKLLRTHISAFSIEKEKISSLEYVSIRVRLNKNSNFMTSQTKRMNRYKHHYDVRKIRIPFGRYLQDGRHTIAEMLLIWALSNNHVTN